LLVEIGTQIERGIDNPQCRSFLKNITGSNKTAKAARQLLLLESSFDPRVIIETAVENRIERLKEWAKRK
jgi:hypothetical protein